MCLSLYKISLLGLGALFFVSCSAFQQPQGRNTLAGKVICIDPGHGGTAATDNFRVGPSGEREEWIDLRVALLLREMLEQRGATVLMTRTEDVQVELKERAMLAVENKADVFLSIHHNATADQNVNFPIIYYHANAMDNKGSVALGKAFAEEIADALYNGDTPVSLVSDHTIFPNSGTAVLRHSHGIPGIIGEASFFSNPEEEKRLKDEEYNRKEAVAYCKALEEFFSHTIPPVAEKYTSGKVTPFTVFREAERMNKDALLWLKDYEEGKQIMERVDNPSPQEAYMLFTRSARSFPDSWVARDCHCFRAEILRSLDKETEGGMEDKRVREYYVEIK